MAGRNLGGLRTACFSLPDDSWVNREMDTTSTADSAVLLHSGFCSGP